MQIVTVADHIPKESYYMYVEFQVSCRRYGYEPLVLKEGYGGLATKPVMLRKAIESGQIKDSRIIFMDAFDCVFQEDPRTADSLDPFKIWFNAEKTEFPKSEKQWPESPTPWRYLNSGFAVGPTELFKACIDAMDQSQLVPDRQNSDGSWFTPNDQELWQNLFLSGEYPIGLDYYATACQTMHGTTEDELDFSGPKIKNRVTGTTPVCLHLNGSKEVWKDKVLAKLGL